MAVVDQRLEAARSRLDRVGPVEAERAVSRDGAWLIDIRSDSQRAVDGVVPGAVSVPRNVLEWRLDPTCEFRLEDGPGLDDVVIVMCDAGYASSLAAASLQDLGFARATDLDGGFQAWRSAGLEVEAGPAVGDV